MKTCSMSFYKCRIVEPGDSKHHGKEQQPGQRVPQVQVFVETDAQNPIVGILGLAGNKIEMLFIDP